VQALKKKNKNDKAMTVRFIMTGYFKALPVIIINLQELIKIISEVITLMI